ncbi:MAG: AraC family transcriptional regulator [Chitinophagaceae bacterium]
MEAGKENRESRGIVYSCYHKMNREGEHFVSEHVLTYQISGSLILNDGIRDYKLEKGSYSFIRRNQLLKFIKKPPDGGDFECLSVYLDQATLKNFSMLYGETSGRKNPEQPVYPLSIDDLLKAYIDSMLAYNQQNNFRDHRLVELKLNEGVMLLLQEKPELGNILFDFSEPHKTDLEDFMNKNYQFNVPISRFAYLTGRSLATFKRDFEKQFNLPPGRWLQQKRLTEAYRLITEKGRTASDIYLDLGFEDLSHFSYAFKKEFGKSPSKIIG